MTITKTLVAAVAATFIAGSAMAGGLLPAENDGQVIQITPPTAATSTLPGWVIPAVIVAALIGVAAAAEDDSATAGEGTAG